MQAAAAAQRQCASRRQVCSGLLSQCWLHSPEELIHDAGVSDLVARLVRGNGAAQLAQHLEHERGGKVVEFGGQGHNGTLASCQVADTLRGDFSSPASPAALHTTQATSLLQAPTHVIAILHSHAGGVAVADLGGALLQQKRRRQEQQVCERGSMISGSMISGGRLVAHQGQAMGRAAAPPAFLPIRPCAPPATRMQQPVQSALHACTRSSRNKPHHYEPLPTWKEV